MEGTSGFRPVYGTWLERRFKIASRLLHDESILQYFKTFHEKKVNLLVNHNFSKLMCYDELMMFKELLPDPVCNKT